jgi:hypothetical protein
VENEKGTRADRDGTTTTAGGTARMTARAGTVGMTRTKGPKDVIDISLAVIHFFLALFILLC